MATRNRAIPWSQLHFLSQSFNSIYYNLKDGSVALVKPFPHMGPSSIIDAFQCHSGSGNIRYRFLFQTVAEWLNYSKMGVDPITPFPPPFTKLLDCRYSGFVSKLLTKTCLIYLRLVVILLRELVVLDDFSLILGGPVAHPDPCKVFCTLTQTGEITKWIYCVYNWGAMCYFNLLHLTRFFRHKCCLRSTRVFTINMQGTQAKAISTKSICMAFYREKQKERD